MSASPLYDLVIIGAGAAAASAATEARRQHRSVAWVERGRSGGTCVNVGCIPSKTLLAAAGDRAAAHRHAFDGLTTSAGEVDLGALIADKERFLDGIRGNLDQRPERLGITAYAGSASFASEQGEDAVTLEVTGETTATIRGRQVIIATGAQPFVPPIPGLDDVAYLTSSTAMSLPTLPASLLVVGGNAVGLEQAQLFSQLGTEVTIVEIAPRVAPLEHPPVSEALGEALTAQGMRLIKIGRAHV